MSIRKLKRLAMRRLSAPRVEFRLPLNMLAGLPAVQAEYIMRKALAEYVKSRHNERKL